MVAKVVRVQGRLVLELDAAAAQKLEAYEGSAVDLSVEGKAVVVTPPVSPEFERVAREILARHAATFEKLSK